MDILIFDMDGVLVKPEGYHRALQETVRLAGISTQYGEVQLTDNQIAQFEALGISSEWHSSALCMAVMVVEKQSGILRDNEHPRSGKLDLVDLFEAIDAQPLQYSALQRGIAAADRLAAKNEVPSDILMGLVTESESIQYSPTLNWFQELILGSENYKQIYRKKPQFQTESYLERYDTPLLDESFAGKIMNWVNSFGHGAAIMTNRPSHGPAGFSGMPDAEMGSRIVGLEGLPIVGKGEILWLAAQTGRPVEHFSKPTWKHAMAAIMAACGWPLEESLHFVGNQPVNGDIPSLDLLMDGKVWVFEDTPGGMVSLQEASERLDIYGIQIEVQKIGVSEDAAKQSALSAQGAIVYSDINQALASLNNF